MGDQVKEIVGWARRRKVLAGIFLAFTLGVGIMIGSVVSDRVQAMRNTFAGTNASPLSLHFRFTARDGKGGGGKDQSSHADLEGRWSSVIGHWSLVVSAPSPHPEGGLAQRDSRGTMSVEPVAGRTRVGRPRSLGRFAPSG